MKNTFLLSIILMGCSSTPKPEPKQPDLCAAVVDPHLCLLSIDKEDFAAHGQNRCEAVKKLKRALEKAGHNPLVVERATCGRVYY